MKGLYLILLAALTFKVYAANDPLDNTITVLGINSSTAVAGISRASLNSIAFAFNSTNSGVNIEIVNDGIAMRVDTIGASASGIDSGEYLRLALDSSEVKAARELHNADVVMVFTRGGNFDEGVCGRAGPLLASEHWIDRGIFDADFDLGRPSRSGDQLNGVDLLGAENLYGAVVVQDSGCDNGTLAAHEFGHIFGGGHILNASNTVGTDTWLERNSHASFEDDFVFFGGGSGVNFCIYTALTSGMEISNFCDITRSDTSFIQTNTYSNGNVSFRQDNTRTVRLTAQSVANYRRPDVILPECDDGIDNDGDGLVDLGDRDCPFSNGTNESGTFGEVPEGPVSNNGRCTIFRPFNLRAEVADGHDCSLSPDTPYLVEWTEGSVCPTGYEIQARPSGEWYERADVQSQGLNSAIVRVGGVAGRDTQIRIRACNRRNECTDFSPERLNLRSLCY